MVTGGLALDQGLMQCMQEQLSRTAVRGDASQALRSVEDAPYAGAFGAALLAARRYRQLEAAGRLPSANQSLGSSGNTSAVTASGTN